MAVETETLGQSTGGELEQLGPATGAKTTGELGQYAGVKATSVLGQAVGVKTVGGLGQPALINRKPQQEEDHEYDDTEIPSAALTHQDPKPCLLPNRRLDGFVWTSAPQPHAVRRRCMLEKYPEIEHLYGHDRTQAIVTVLTVGAQIVFAYYVSVIPMSTMTYLLLCFFLSGTLNHSLFSAMHEGCHRTVFPGKYSSELYCIAATVPMAVPAAIPFKRYHLDHHVFLGVDGMDPDLPTELECLLFGSTIGKLVWIALLPATYSLRPMITRPKHLVPMDVVNWVICLAVDVSIAYFWGLKSLGYLIIGTFFSMNFHPFAGHFIAEHFIWPDSDPYQETSSYYGVWNYWTYNLGYHIEHHDFPRIPGSKLPMLKQIAPEFYQAKPTASWTKTMWSFILLPSMSQFNRIKRLAPGGGQLNESNEKAQLHISRRRP